jgi:hypothetical protein
MVKISISQFPLGFIFFLSYLITEIAAGYGIGPLNRPCNPMFKVENNYNLSESQKKSFEHTFWGIIDLEDIYLGEEAMIEDIVVIKDTLNDGSVDVHRPYRYHLTLTPEFAILADRTKDCKPGRGNSFENSADDTEWEKCRNEKQIKLRHRNFKIFFYIGQNSNSAYFYLQSMLDWTFEK